MYGTNFQISLFKQAIYFVSKVIYETNRNYISLINDAKAALQLDQQLLYTCHLIFVAFCSRGILLV